jgi:hypothetical protein
MAENEKNFIQLGRGYLSLLYLQAQYEIFGKKPPDDLMDGIAHLEQQIRHISDESE